MVDRATKKPFPRKLSVAKAIHEVGMEYGISVYPGFGGVDGVQGDHIIIAPPYNVTVADVDRIVELTVQTLETFFDQLSSC